MHVGLRIREEGKKQIETLDFKYPSAVLSLLGFHTPRVNGLWMENIQRHTPQLTSELNLCRLFSGKYSLNSTAEHSFFIGVTLHLAFKVI